jgi:hypothetical protein
MSVRNDSEGVPVATTRARDEQQTTLRRFAKDVVVPLLVARLQARIADDEGAARHQHVAEEAPAA